MSCRPTSAVRGECDSEELAARVGGRERGGRLLEYELEAGTEGVDRAMIFSMERESAFNSGSGSKSTGEVINSCASASLDETRTVESSTSLSPIVVVFHSANTSTSMSPSSSSSISNSGGTPSAPLTLSQISSDLAKIHARA
jgi:hypothetical protein